MKEEVLKEARQEEMIEEVLKPIQKLGKKGLSLKDIVNRTHLERHDVLESLSILEDRLLITKTKENKYISNTDNKHIAGKLVMARDRNFGFIIPDDDPKKRIFISSNELGGALHGDRIMVETYTKADGRLYGKVVARFQENKFCNAVIEFHDGNYYARPKNIHANFNFDVLMEGLNGATIGDCCRIKIYPEKQRGEYHGNVERIYGKDNEPGVDILMIVEELGIPYGTNSEIEEELKNIPVVVSKEEIEGRLDLRDDIIFTIDGDDAKDYDDAISKPERLANGNYLFGVHIADVGHYVKEGSAIDKEAYKRGTSNYLADRVIPMIPPKLSNGICSLVENQDRLTKSVFIEIDTKGRVVNYSIHKSVIRSKKRMTYREVNMVLDGKKVAGYDSVLTDALFKTKEVSDLITNQKLRRGMIKFDKDEAKIEVDENGMAIGIDCRKRGRAEQIIEDFMIAANEAVAKHTSELCPTLYRVHEQPDEEKLEKMNIDLATIDCSLDLILGDKPITSKDFQRAIDKYKDNENYDIISTVALRSMKKACYSVSNNHHFGLASIWYTHFTSPIRRYPDLIVHRILDKLLTDEYNMHDFNKDAMYLEKVAEHTSMCERRADECEIEVNKMKMAEYMNNRQKEMEEKGLEPDIYEGKVTWIDQNKGLYIRLKNLIEGNIPTNMLPDGYYGEHLTYVCPDYVYKLGTPVKVKLYNADKEKRVIQFSIGNQNKVLKKVPNKK